ncbi:putative Type I inositol polyphosphate 5-phosphatase [Quillaja saponaria]|uniref:Type I inositol polyphosphate 5-phosphatase n=1 Tax=Quillaja saponaria TaxID=32244 RepID=A0AAD7PVX3_QUISA|nr:putative Type I inositol polyphosphate 5-phosphatase [Quillaja saponaria]
MEDWLNTQNNSADVYVIGFQEIVPLNAGNILGFKNSKISKKWNSLIEAALNNRIPVRPVEEDKIAEPQKVYPLKEHTSVENDNSQDYECIISKQMVGVYVTVWVHSDLRQYIQHPSVSCVGCGIMGCLGNKGSVSVRFCLHGTSLCFVCSHLASGGREGDQMRRNSNAADILHHTSFPAGPLQDLPQKILHHKRVVWLGDLNYRIYMSNSETQSLVKRREWNVCCKMISLRSSSQRAMYSKVGMKEL